MTCPNCAFDTGGAPECPRCGVVVAKFLARRTSAATPSVDEAPLDSGDEEPVLLEDEAPLDLGAESLVAPEEEAPLDLGAEEPLLLEDAAPIGRPGAADPRLAAADEILRAALRSPRSSPGPAVPWGRFEGLTLSPATRKRLWALLGVGVPLIFFGLLPGFCHPVRKGAKGPRPQPAAVTQRLWELDPPPEKRQGPPGELTVDPPIRAPLSWSEGAGAYRAAEQVLRDEDIPILLVFVDAESCCGALDTAFMADPHLTLDRLQKVWIRRSDAASAWLAETFKVRAYPAVFVKSTPLQWPTKVSPQEGLVEAIRREAGFAGATDSISMRDRLLRLLKHDDANAATVLFWAGIADLQEYYLPKAFEHLKASLELEDDPVTLHALAYTCVLEKNLDCAEAYAMALVERYPTFREGTSFAVRAAVRKARGDDKGALDDAHRACEMGAKKMCNL